MAAGVANPGNGGSAALFELHNGDVMKQVEFHRLYDLTPDHFKAELINGVVFVASPVRVWHGDYHGLLTTICGNYRLGTPGVQLCCDSTVLLGPEDEPQPDILLRILSECGGQSRVSSDRCIAGAPESVVEISHSSRSVDLNAKRRAYAINGVREYIVASIGERRLYWFDLQADTELSFAADGILRSRQFPGLWIDVSGFFSIDAARLQAAAQAGLGSPEHAEFVQRLEAERVRIAAAQSKRQ